MNYRAYLGMDVELVWEDSAAPEGKWQPHSTVDGIKIMDIRTIGTLARVEDKFVVMVGSRCDDCVSDITAIPVSCILSVRIVE